MWGDIPAIGQRFIFLDHLREVVGVVEDGKYLEIQESPQPVVYLPLSQNEQADTVFAVRSYRPANEMAPANRGSKPPEPAFASAGRFSTDAASLMAAATPS